MGGVVVEGQFCTWNCSTLRVDINLLLTCAMVKSRYTGDGHPTFNRESL